MYPFKGQRQKYYLVRLKENARIDLESYETPEFEEYKFVTGDELFKQVAFFKRKVYRRVIEYFTKEGFI
jgi:putative (di)nucleoside polyphosphate hydrolase